MCGPGCTGGFHGRAPPETKASAARGLLVLLLLLLLLRRSHAGATSPGSPLSPRPSHSHLGPGAVRQPPTQRSLALGRASQPLILPHRLFSRHDGRPATSCHLCQPEVMHDHVAASRALRLPGNRSNLRLSSGPLASSVVSERKFRFDERGCTASPLMGDYGSGAARLTCASFCHATFLLFSSCPSRCRRSPVLHLTRPASP